MISVGAGGRLILDVSMSGAAGVVIDGGGVLEIAQNFSNAATFASGGVGTLQLDGPALFSGVIAGLASAGNHRLLEQRHHRRAAVRR